MVLKKAWFFRLLLLMIFNDMENTFLIFSNDDIYEQWSWMYPGPTSPSHAPFFPSPCCPGAKEPVVSVGGCSRVRFIFWRQKRATQTEDSIHTTHQTAMDVHRCGATLRYAFLLHIGPPPPPGRIAIAIGSSSDRDSSSLRCLSPQSLERSFCFLRSSLQGWPESNHSWESEVGFLRKASRKMWNKRKEPNCDWVELSATWWNIVGKKRENIPTVWRDECKPFSPSAAFFCDLLRQCDGLLQRGHLRLHRLEMHPPQVVRLRAGRDRLLVLQVLFCMLGTPPGETLHGR